MNPDTYLRPHTNYIMGKTWGSDKVQTMKLQVENKTEQGTSFGTGRALQRTQITRIKENPDKWASLG